jgi:threonine dehydrogenase-like Zn-dependent dehydrogenase
MRALWLEENQLRYVDNAPKPIPESGEALIKVTLAGVCSTDLEMVRGFYPFRGIPGHEFVGQVVSSPDEPQWEGKRVVGEINIACGRCSMCMRGIPHHCDHRKTLGIHDWDGVFGEFIRLPLINLHRVPDGLSDEAAVFTEPLAAAHEILEQTSIDPTDRVLIIGAGRLGQLIAYVIQGTGCHLDVLVRHPKPRRLLTNNNIRSIDMPDLAGQKYDLVVEATGSAEGFKLACQTVLPRGRIVLKSTYKGHVEVNFSSLVVDEITLIGSRCGSFKPALELLAQGNVYPHPLIDAIFPLIQGVDAFKLAGEPGILKVLVKP